LVEEPQPSLSTAVDGELGKPRRRPIEKQERVYNSAHYNPRFKLSLAERKRLEEIVVGLRIRDGVRYAHAVHPLVKMIAQDEVALCVIKNRKQGAATLKMLRQLYTQLVRLDPSFGPLLRPIIKGYALAMRDGDNNTNTK
jgi:hypothetical protein